MEQNEDSNQDLLVRASAINQEYQNLQSNIELVNNQIIDLEIFQEAITEIINSKEKEMLSSLGKGVFIKTNMIEKQLFVEVGANVVVKKNPKELRDTVNEQITILMSTRESTQKQLKNYEIQLRDMIEEAQARKNSN